MKEYSKPIFEEIIINFEDAILASTITFKETNVWEDITEIL